MKNKLLTLLVVFGFTLPGLAQSSDSVSYKNQLGSIASPQLDKFFTANRALPLGLMYRRQLKPDLAWRAISIFSYNRSNFDDPDHANPNYDDKNLYYNISLGLEKQLILNNKFTAYAGMDVGFSHNLYRRDFEIYFNQQYDGTSVYFKEAGYRWWKTNSANLKPFAGSTFNISRRLSLSLETAFLGQFSNEKYKSRFNDYILENAHVLNSEYGEVYEKGWGNSTTNSLRVQYLPISNLQLSYKF